MDYAMLVARIYADGREAAGTSYQRPDQTDKLEGATQGFLEASLTQSPAELAVLLKSASDRREEALRGRWTQYWYWRCREAEIEWTANVISAALYNMGQPTIVTPTARGMLKAAEILGAAHAD